MVRKRTKRRSRMGSKRSSKRTSRRSSRRKSSKIGGNRVLTLQRVQKQVFPKSTFIKLESEYQGILGVGSAQNNYFDINLNSCILPWDVTGLGALAHPITGVFTAMPNTLNPLTFNHNGTRAFVAPGNNGVYLNACVHASKVVFESSLQNSGDNFMVACAPVNPNVAAPATTYEGMMTRAFSKGKFMRSQFGSNRLENYVSMRNILGLTRTQYSVISKSADNTSNGYVGDYFESYLGRPFVRYIWRFAYQTGDAAITANPLFMSLRLVQWVEFFRYSEESIT